MGESRVHRGRELEPPRGSIGPGRWIRNLERVRNQGRIAFRLGSGNDDLLVSGADR
jgi:hypothetical protein